MMAGSVALTRLTSEHLGPVAPISAATTLLLCVWVLLHSRTRYSHRHSIGPETSRQGGLAPAALVLGIAAMAMTELADLLLS